jgi:hypothetical protein
LGPLHFQEDDAAREVHVFDPQRDSLGYAQACERAEQDGNTQAFGHCVVELPDLLGCWAELLDVAGRWCGPA